MISLPCPFRSEGQLPWKLWTAASAVLLAIAAMLTAYSF